MVLFAMVLIQDCKAFLYKKNPVFEFQKYFNLPSSIIDKSWIMDKRWSESSFLAYEYRGKKRNSYCWWDAWAWYADSNYMEGAVCEWGWDSFVWSVYFFNYIFNFSNYYQAKERKSGTPRIETLWVKTGNYFSIELKNFKLIFLGLAYLNSKDFYVIAKQQIRGPEWERLHIWERKFQSTDGLGPDK